MCPSLSPKGKATHPASASASALWHPRCRCGCKNDAQWSLPIVKLDEKSCRNWQTPCITSTYAGSLLLAKGQRASKKLHAWGSQKLPAWGLGFTEITRLKLPLGFTEITWVHRNRLGFTKIAWSYPEITCLRNYLLGVEKYHRLRLGVHRNHSLEITLGVEKLPAWGWEISPLEA
jgi:hypothetical protein